jgi:hypothetical protein
MNGIMERELKHHRESEERTADEGVCGKHTSSQ